MTKAPLRRHGVRKLSEIGFGATMLAFGLLAWFVWFPQDIPSGFLVENATGILQPGDAFFPYVLVTVVLILTLLHLARAVLRPVENFVEQDAGTLSVDNLRFLAALTAVISASLALMYLTGPAVVRLLNVLDLTDSSYRALIDTVPFKYLGFVIGGTALPTILVCWSERRFHVTTLYAGALVVGILTLVFDVLLTNVLLPPNGDF